MSQADGFAGQRLQVLPRPVVSAALRRAPTSRLVVTDAGYFPHATSHGRARRQGAAQTIVILVTEGEGFCDLGEARHTVTAGQVLVIPAGTPHHYGARESHPWSIWWMHVTGPDVSPLLAAARLTADRPVVTLRNTYHHASLIESALARLERDNSVPSMTAASGAAWHFLALLAADQAPDGARGNPVGIAVDYLQSRVGERVDVDELAGLVGLSPSRLGELFRAETGTSILAYQTSLRMARARALLDTSDLTVAAIARACGYSDPFYFARHFRRTHGTTPSEYRAHDKG